jgi:DNA-binding MarR family transcriptional regulator
MKDYFEKTADLRTDEHGCLFDQRTRDFFKYRGVDRDISHLEAVAALRNAAKQLHIAQERWAERQGLSEGRLGLLLVLGRFGQEGINLGRLADLMRVTPRNVTGLVDNLEKDGLVERLPDPEDRRAVRARLTTAGTKRIDSIWRPSIDRQFPLTKGFSRKELVQLRHLCLKLLANVKEMEKEEALR